LKLSLVVPELEDLWFKKKIKEDPQTMDYNAGYDLNIQGYNREDGTIQTDIEQLKNVWFKRWINNKPTNFYYYIKFNDKFIGEIYAKLDNERSSYEIGIVIKGEYRGRGFSTPAVNLLCEELKRYGVKYLYHELPISRKAAIKADINNGFIIVKENIPGMKKFGKIEKLILLEKTL